KRVIVNFILCGCFDEIEQIREEKDRLRLIQKYAELIGDKKLVLQFIEDPNHKYNYYWILQQKQLCGLGMIDYTNIFKKNRGELGFTTEPLYDGYILQEEQSIGKNVVVGGILVEVRERNTRKGVMAQLILNNNDQNIFVTLWPEAYTLHKDIVLESKDRPMFIN